MTQSGANIRVPGRDGLCYLRRKYRLCAIHARAAGTLYGPGRMGIHGAIQDVPQTGWAASTVGPGRGSSRPHWAWQLRRSNKYDMVPLDLRDRGQTMLIYRMDTKAPRSWSLLPE